MTDLVTDLREAAKWLVDECEGVEAPQFLEGDIKHDQVLAFAVDKMWEAADKIDKDRDMDVSLMELLAKARAEKDNPEGIKRAFVAGVTSALSWLHAGVPSDDVDKAASDYIFGLRARSTPRAVTAEPERSDLDRQARREELERDPDSSTMEDFRR